MPIYEFYCHDCHTIFSFFARTVNTAARPTCPRCRRRKLQRQVSAFAVAGKAREGSDDDAGDLPIDEAKMENAMNSLAAEAERVNEDDPRQAAQLMRKFSKMTGVEFGGGMQEALKRLEAGEDPEKIESEMGDLMEEEEEPLLLSGQKGAKGGRRRSRPPPRRDPRLYDL